MNMETKKGVSRLVWRNVELRNTRNGQNLPHMREYLGLLRRGDPLNVASAGHHLMEVRGNVVGPHVAGVLQWRVRE